MLNFKIRRIPIVMAGNISVNNTFQAKAKPIMDNFRVIKGFTGKTSITALSKDLIMQFPVIMSAGIDIDDAVAIAKGLEKMFATMFLAVWTADAGLKVSEYGMNGVRDFVKKYHNNDDIPDVLQYTGDFLSLTDTLLGSGKESAVEDIDVDVYPGNGQLPALEGAKLWDCVESELALESLNDMYLPIKKTHKQITRITAALERTQFYDSSEPKASGLNMSNLQKAAYQSSNSSILQSTGRPGAGYGTKTDTGIIDPKRNIAVSGANSEGKGPAAQILANSDKLGNMVPTLIDVTFLVRGPGAGGSSPHDIEVRSIDKNGKTEITKRREYDSVDVRQQRAIVGVKTMIRLVNSPYMISNVITSIQDQSLAFKFVKYTRGEMKVGRDMILGISRMKQDARASDQADIWFAALRKRKRAAKTFRFGNSGINPFATLVLTTDEVEQIKAQAGYDVMAKDTAKLLMDNLFLLGFMIVNPATGIVYTMFDGSETFSTTTLKNLRSSKDKDINSAEELREMRKLMGRL